MQKTAKSPDEFLQTVDEHFRDDMIILDREISEVMKGETRCLWEGKFWGGTDQNIIAYGDYVYERPKKKRVEWFINGLAAQKNYISVYLHAVEDGKYVTEKYGPEVGKVKCGKSTISFKSLDDIDLEKLLALVAKSRDLMVAEREAQS